jgi:hypothetical protein
LGGNHPPPTPVTIPVIAQSKVSGLATQFRLDEMSLVTERSDRCATDVSGIVTIL